MPCVNAWHKFFYAGTNIMTPAQLRMARAAVRLGVRELAELAGVSAPTLTRFETEAGGIRHDTAQKVQAALGKLGVRFVTEGGQACICYSPPADDPGPGAG